MTWKEGHAKIEFEIMNSYGLIVYPTKMDYQNRVLVLFSLFTKLFVKICGVPLKLT